MDNRKRKRVGFMECRMVNILALFASVNISFLG